MEKKQNGMSTYCTSSKLIFLIILISLKLNVHAQNSNIVSGSLKVTSVFNTKDSTLTMTYQCIDSFSILLWVGDFNIGAVVNYNDISGKYIASPIVNEIYLFSNNMHNKKMSNSYFFRTDSSELNFYNYKMLNDKEELRIKIPIKDASLYTLIKQNKLIIKGAISFIDPTGFENQLRNRNLKNKNAWSDAVGTNTMLKLKDKFYLDPIVIENINWQFNRPTKNIGINGHAWSPHYGDLSKIGFIKPLNKVDKIENYYSKEYLYSFANKHYFISEIKIK